VSERFVVVNESERGKQLDVVLAFIQDIFNKYKVSNIEAIWLLEHIKSQILEDDLKEAKK